MIEQLSGRRCGSFEGKMEEAERVCNSDLIAVNLANIKTYQLTGMSALNVMVRTSLPS